MEYLIKISYQTEDSLSSNDEIEYLDLTWNDLNIAKENLQRIKAHYEMYQDLNYGNKLTREQILTNNKSKDWFVNIPKLYCISSNNAIDENAKKQVGDNNWEYRPDIEYAKYCLHIKSDTGNDMQLRAFWCGYFEKLHSIEIEINNAAMKIEF